MIKDHVDFGLTRPNDRLNFYLIILGFSLVYQQIETYNLALINLKDSLGPLFDSYSRARERVDDDMRNLLNLNLQAAVLLNRADHVRHILAYGQTNTFLLFVTEQEVIFALNVAVESDQSQLKDYSTLREMVLGRCMFKVTALDEQAESPQAMGAGIHESALKRDQQISPQRRRIY